MKKSLLFLFVFFLCVNVHAQVTQINNNKSLEPIIQLNSNKVIAVSSIDQTLWATDGTLAGTIPLSACPTYRFYSLTE